MLLKRKKHFTKNGVSNYGRLTVVKYRTLRRESLSEPS
jgi:hypothetical protein